MRISDWSSDVCSSDLWALRRRRERSRRVADVPEHAISEKFLAGTGPGGQNVNKVATACQLRVNVYALGLDPDAYRRLKALAGSKMNAAGELVILARSFRTQEATRSEEHTSELQS